MTTDESQGAGGPDGMNDEVALLVRMAGTAGAIGAERVARVRAAVHGAWRGEYTARQVKTRRRWLAVAMPLVAVGSGIIAYAIWGPIRGPAPALVAHIDHLTGRATGSAASLAAGGVVLSGSTVTTSAGTLALTLTSGVRLRLDASSSARVDSATDVALERGAVYVDSAGASSISIHTPAGVVRDIGTQFEVRVREDRLGAGMRIRVRDGEVRVTAASGADARAGAGEEVLSAPDGSISRRAIAVTGREWAWAERAAPLFSVKGKTLGTFLDWVSREGAWAVTFADSGFSAGARAIVLDGKPDLLKGLTPAEALAVILPTCGLRHRIEINGGNRVVIERETSRGPSR